MTKSRMEAFSDGVVAILITIMVLQLTVPKGATLSDLAPLGPIFLSYVLSFVNLAIWWNNHHHLLQAAHHVDGRILWANVHLLFWLSLVPWATAWMGEREFASVPVAIYGAILLLAGVAYYILVRALIAHEGEDSTIATAIGRDVKGRISPVLYLLAIAVAPFAPWGSMAIYVLVAAMWFIPDRRFERRIETHAGGSHSEAPHRQGD